MAYIRKVKASRSEEEAEVASKPPPPSHLQSVPRVRREVLVDRDTVTAEDEVAYDFEVISTRHAARCTALQLSYSVALTGQTLTEAWGNAKLRGELRHIDFLKRLLQQTQDHQAELDVEIEKRVERWTIDRLALTDHLLLRLALCELLFLEETPPKVILNEAIEIAKEFSTSQSGRFINGILDASVQDRLPKGEL